MMKNLLFWLVFPFLIPQALYVRQTATRVAAPSGTTEGSSGRGNQVRLLAIGDSIAAGVGASRLSKALIGQTATALAEMNHCRVSWQAMGVSGYNAAQVLDHLVPKLPSETFDFIMVSVGVNDITGLTTLRSWRQNISALLEALRNHSPDAVIAVAGMPPMHVFPLLPQPLRATFGMRARVFDQATEAVILKHDKTIHIQMDFEADPGKFSEDGYHPSEDSYVAFGRHMAERLIEANIPV